MNQQPVATSLSRNKPSDDHNILYMVAFKLDRQIFTLPIDMIYQIIDMVYLTPLPEFNETIEGIFNYHGLTVPVVNLRSYFNLPKLPIHLHTPIILVAYANHIIGLIVDSVIDVVNQAQSSIFLPKDLLPDHLGEISILDGLIPDSENYMLMLNLEHLFTSQKQANLIETIDHFVPAHVEVGRAEEQVEPEKNIELLNQPEGSVPLPQSEPDHNGGHRKSPKARKKSGRSKPTERDR